MLFNLLQTDIAEAIPAPQEMSYSLIEMAAKGGPLMWVLLALSIVAIYIFGKKWWQIRHAGKLDKDFMMDIRDYIHEGKIKSARTLCTKYDTPVARMVETGLAHIGRPMADIQSAVENTGNMEVAKLEASLPYLATISGGAPMIGFLGTVLGMFQAFGGIANDIAANAKPVVLAAGVSQAIITTVFGLVISIPCLACHAFLRRRTAKRIAGLETLAVILQKAF